MYLPTSDNKTSNVHEGVCDIIACLGADGILRATPFIIKFATCVPSKPVTLWVNGEKTDVTLKINDKLEGYFELTQQEYHDEGLSKGDITRVNQKSINGIAKG
jgi:phosphatidate phosphatase PAH1